MNPETKITPEILLADVEAPDTSRIILDTEEGVGLYPGDGIYLRFVVQELVQNCLEKKATEVTINLRSDPENNRMLLKVTDNIQYNPDDALLLLNNLNQDTPQSDKKPDYCRGFGICDIRRFFRGNGGDLIYHTENGRIVAVASWETGPLQPQGRNLPNRQIIGGLTPVKRG